MEVILKKDHATVGKAMDVVVVKDGYARNYLIPRGIAVPATEGNRRAVEEAQRLAERRSEKKSAAARALAAKIAKVPCTIKVNVGEDDKMFGSVGTSDIAEFLGKEGFEIDRHAVMLKEPIKELGVYDVPIQLFKDVRASLNVWVVKDESS